MGLIDKLPGATRIYAGLDAVTGASWSFATKQTTHRGSTDVRRLEAWMLTRPYSGLLAAHHINMRVTDVEAASNDLRKEGDWVSITCDNPILGDKAVATTVFSLARDKRATFTAYTFTSDTTDVRLGGESKGKNFSIPAAIEGTLAFNYGHRSIVFEVQARVPEGNYSRLVNAGIAARGLNPEIVAGEIVENILVAFDNSRRS